MTTKEFDELALKVAKELLDTSPIGYEINVTGYEINVTNLFLDYARRLREEWVKGLEPKDYLLKSVPMFQTQLLEGQNPEKWHALYTLED